MKRRREASKTQLNLMKIGGKKKCLKGGNAPLFKLNHLYSTLFFLYFVQR